ncbi:MAG: serine/threonine-protein kinase [Candidatus Acidiferrales bacterium]
MNYQVMCLSPLGSGGNADLQLGRLSDNGEQVVVKFLRDFHLPHARQAFAREVRILSQNLPGMVRLLFANTETERPYYVMPFLSGGSLRQYAGRLSGEQLLAVAHEVGRSLAALHARHVAHGDIKPDNILVSGDGRLQVADPLGNGFGCTVLFSQNHGGTPGYWAPEVHAGNPISNAGDLYSYGATLYHLATGQKPRDGQRLDLVVGYWNGCSRIRRTIAACCHPDPAIRPNILEALRLLHGESWIQLQQVRQEQSQLAAVFAVGILGLLVVALTT